MLITRRPERYRRAIPAGGKLQVRRGGEELTVGTDAEEEEEAWSCSWSLPWIRGID
jgi:hypothetical protein